VTDFLQDHPDGLIMTMDQLTLYFPATPTRVWSPVGRTPRVWVTPQRRGGQPLQHFLTEEPRLELVYFPPACPDLNPQEQVWEQTRDTISHNHLLTDFGQLCAAFLRHLENTLFPIDFLSRYAPPILYEV